MSYDLLSGATRYLMQSLLLAGGADLSAPTPCCEWDLRRLLWHVRASLADITGVLRGIDRRSDLRSGFDPVAAVRSGIVEFLVASAAPRTQRCEIWGRPLPAGVVVHVGAIEAALHAWDIAQACRVDRPIPADVASALLWVSPPLATAGLAAGVFAAALPTPATAPPSDQLLALFGRRPGGGWARTGFAGPPGPPPHGPEPAPPAT